MKRHGFINCKNRKPGRKNTRLFSVKKGKKTAWIWEDFDHHAQDIYFSFYRSKMSGIIATSSSSFAHFQPCPQPEFPPLSDNRLGGSEREKILETRSTVSKSPDGFNDILMQQLWCLYILVPGVCCPL